MAHKPGHKFKSPAEFELGGYKGLYSPERERIRAERISAKHILAGIERIQNMNREQIHMALAAAGMTPGVGMAADLVDMVLYASEGEYGMSALSGVGAIPIVGQVSTAYKELRALENSSDYIGNVMIRFWHGKPNMPDSNILRNIDNGSGLEKTVVGGQYDKVVGVKGGKKVTSDSSWMNMNSLTEGKPFFRHYGLDDARIVGGPMADAIQTERAYEGLSTQVWTSTNPRYVIPFAKYGTKELQRYKELIRQAAKESPQHIGKEGIIIGFDVSLSEIARLRNVYIKRSAYNMNRPGYISNDPIVRKVTGMPDVADIKSFQGSRGYYKGGGVTDPSITRWEGGIPQKNIARVYYGGFDDFSKISELGVGTSKSQFTFNPVLRTTEWVGGINTYNNAPLLRGLKRFGGWDGIQKAFIKEFGTMEDITRSYR